MTTAQFVTLLPLTVLALTTLVVMLSIAARRDHRTAVLLTLVGLILAFAALPVAAAADAPRVTSLLLLDRFAFFFIGLNLMACFVIAILAYRYLEAQPENREELYVLLLLATLGASVLAAASHFASFFLGLEILSVSLYGLLAYARNRAISVEAGVKYLILAATSAAVLLFGMALVYAAAGTLDFNELAGASSSPEASLLLIAGAGLVLVGVGYKLALVPFHLWTPDVYEGAPAPAAAFVATVSKAAAFALLLRLFVDLPTLPGTTLFLVLAVVAVASMIGGNLLGLLQTNVKRLLAYSSIAHMGYLLVALLAGGAAGISAASFYLVTYVAASLGAFGVIIVASRVDRDADRLDDYRGLFWRRPWLAAAFTLSVLSLAGIPLTGGFIGKFYLVAVGVRSSLWILVLVLVLSSVAGLYYYLRMILPLFARPGDEADGAFAFAPTVPIAGRWILAAVAVVVIALGTFPGPIIQLAQGLVVNLA
ncbi:MAG TPA: NADH-quinone oxidoreductase subunit N [Chloroflexota bacterium]|nr:NADH-quinone oxidoreductase subunit N [Chloroflexota bacterium]